MSRPIFALYYLKHADSDRDAQLIFDPEAGILSVYVSPKTPGGRTTIAAARLTKEDRERLARALLGEPIPDPAPREVGK